ncbi:MAG: Indole-3-acetyl-aspartic acid hydrolase [bacterium ADurb.Bin363]|nr:MAG: Indole-3-acetyl-aspartic acid hydrolase [bacterium ADurb.Bin363]
MIDKINKITERIESKIISYRRDFHRYPETGWSEFRTASLVAKRLKDLGYTVKAGREVLKEEDMMGLPSEEELEINWKRALTQGGDPFFMEALKGGFTGVVGILENGSGPVVAMRFDMDALDLAESESTDHRPTREGFASINKGVMHACGHDTHTAAGLGIAEILMELKEHIHGKVKLIFQPAEEGVRGAKAMVTAGVLDDVNFLLGHHISSKWKKGEISPGMGGYFATQKFDAIFKGQAAHAGAKPEEGKNALLSAATAVLNLYAIPEHSKGATRINVGKLTAGTGRNIICDRAHLLIETRGENDRVSDYVFKKAIEILNASAMMYDCRLEIKPMGSARSRESDKELAERVEKIAKEIGAFSFVTQKSEGGCEDITYMMAMVQQNGGLATNIGIGANLSEAIGKEVILRGHTPEFDIDEGSFKYTLKLLTAVAMDIFKGNG